MKITKNLILFFCIMIPIENAAADVASSTFVVKKPYNLFRAKLESELVPRFEKKAGLFNSGVKIAVDEIDNTTIYHFKDYQMTGQTIGELGSIILSKDKNKLTMVVNNHHQFGGTDLHLIESTRNWLAGVY
jgi:hypothetical protein